MAFFILGSAAVAIVGLLVYTLLFVGHRGRNYLPGPPTLPIIGNVHQIPRKGAHFKFTEWAKIYGGIFSLKLGSGDAIVITDRRLVRELCDKKSSIYSDRPSSYVAQKLITGGDHLLTMNYGPEWRALRKLIHQEFTETMCEKEHIELQNAEAVQMLRDMVLEPENYMLHPKRFSNSVVMSILYGIRTPTPQETHMKRLYELMEHFSSVMEIGATPPVDVYPLLKFIPERFMGCWVTRASQVHHEMHRLYADMVDAVRRRRQRGENKDSFMDRVIDKQEKNGLNDHQLWFLAGVSMEGGSDTSAASIQSFMKAMTCNPEVQKRAQAEIDAVVGEGRSPQWSDYSRLPYVAQVVKETMRWRPIGGLGVPHCLSEDDWVEGKFIPKGTIVFVNIWGLGQDEPDADTFDPTRFDGRTLLAPEYAASADYKSRDHYNYGVGRRLCPGIHLAERNLFLGMAKLLWAFSFEKRLDESGRPMEPDTNYATGWSEGFITCTHDFPCKVTSRSQQRVDTIMSEFAKAEAEIFTKYD